MKMILVGGGGHSAVVIEVIRALACYTLVGIVDPHSEAHRVLGLPVIGNDDRLPEMRAQGVETAFVAIGSNQLRQRLGVLLLSQGFRLPAIVHPSALVSPSATIGDGTIIMARAVIGARARVGAFAIVNTAAIIEHDNEIGAAAHVAPGVALAGSVTVGERSLLGIGSAVLPGIK